MIFAKDKELTEKESILLSGGLAVATVLDEARIARARAKPGPRR
jgi:hypothetical protein